MGYEYFLRVPEESRDMLAGEQGQALLDKIHAADPPTAPRYPNVSVSIIPDGLLFCDHLSNREIAHRVLGAAVVQLLRGAASVTIEEA
jgi:hypothetical protein